MICIYIYSIDIGILAAYAVKTGREDTDKLAREYSDNMDTVNLEAIMPIIVDADIPIHRGTRTLILVDTDRPECEMRILLNAGV